MVARLLFCILVCFFCFNLRVFCLLRRLLVSFFLFFVCFFFCASVFFCFRLRLHCRLFYPMLFFPLTSYAFLLLRHASSATMPRSLAIPPACSFLLFLLLLSTLFPVAACCHLGLPVGARSSVRPVDPVIPDDGTTRKTGY